MVTRTPAGQRAGICDAAHKLLAMDGRPCSRRPNMERSYTERTRMPSGIRALGTSMRTGESELIRAALTHIAHTQLLAERAKETGHRESSFCRSCHRRRWRQHPSGEYRRNPCLFHPYPLVIFGLSTGNESMAHPAPRIGQRQGGALLDVLHLFAHLLDGHFHLNGFSGHLTVLRLG